jgi:hypothetical protein
MVLHFFLSHLIISLAVVSVKYHRNDTAETGQKFCTAILHNRTIHSNAATDTSMPNQPPHFALYRRCSRWWMLCLNINWSCHSLGFAESCADRSYWKLWPLCRPRYRGPLNLLSAFMARKWTISYHISTDEVYGSFRGAGKACLPNPLLTRSQLSLFGFKSQFRSLCACLWRNLHMCRMSSALFPTITVRPISENRIQIFIQNCTEQKPLPTIVTKI